MCVVHNNDSNDEGEKKRVAGNHSNWTRQSRDNKHARALSKYEYEERESKSWKCSDKQ